MCHMSMCASLHVLTIINSVFVNTILSNSRGYSCARVWDTMPGIPVSRFHL